MEWVSVKVISGRILVLLCCQSPAERWWCGVWWLTRSPVDQGEPRVSAAQGGVNLGSEQGEPEADFSHLGAHNPEGLLSHTFHSL
jgi:hypothetical protein